MMRINRATEHRGFSLLELIVALGTGSMLLVGLSSAIFMALEATNPTLSSADSAAEGHEQLAYLISDLQHALTMTEKTATAITVSVPDRTGDAAPESVRYSWSGTAGAPLLRNSTIPVVEDVHQFSLNYYEPGGTVKYVQISLQVGTDSAAQLVTSVPMLNAP
jgi:Tfp pilus assembly protein PilW